ncbi:SIMPL domain-containing protein [Clostridium sp. BJN0013]|uniref:SIMPL domain-containing protein n=1 Tax=Clostridium sp. BJN0013 TaxID=3236840 RepID=UPI0034C69D63
MNLESQHCNYDKTMELAAIAKTQINPQLNVQFSVKDKTVASQKLLINVVENAKLKAKTLAKASGVILGDLISIDYN